MATSITAARRAARRAARKGARKVAKKDTTVVRNPIPTTVVKNRIITTPAARARARAAKLSSLEKKKLILKSLVKARARADTTAARNRIITTEARKRAGTTKARKRITDPTSVEADTTEARKVISVEKARVKVLVDSVVPSKISYLNNTVDKVFPCPNPTEDGRHERLIQ